MINVIFALAYPDSGRPPFAAVGPEVGYGTVEAAQVWDGLVSTVEDLPEDAMLLGAWNMVTGEIVSDVVNASLLVQALPDRIINGEAVPPDSPYDLNLWAGQASRQYGV